MSTHAGALDAIERVVKRGSDADDVLREVVAILHARLPHLERVWITFVEGGELVEGPAAGATRHDVIESFPIVFNDSEVARLYAPGFLLQEADRALLARVSVLVAPYALVAWDTGGEAWTP